MAKFSYILYVIYALSLAIACFRSPIPDEFDRYLYEGIIRTDRGEDPQQIYDSIKRESPRMEASSRQGNFNSVDHFLKLQPLFRVKPLYLCLVRALSARWLSIQTAISLISAVSLFALGLIFLLWTRSPFLSALLLSSPAATDLGRSGTPDALAAAFLISSLWAVKRDRPYIALAILVAAVWLRTDHVLLLGCVCFWLWLTVRAPAKAIFAFALAGALSVFLVNHFAAWYGWSVLFYINFVGGFPGEIAHPNVTVPLYLRVFFTNAAHLLPQIAIYLLLAALAWRISTTQRDLLVIVAATLAMHYAMFPTVEVRYLLWGCLTAGLALILSLDKEKRSRSEMSA